MSWTKAEWKHPKRKRTQTGQWWYNYAKDQFHIHLDSKDPITGLHRTLITHGSSPEWGKWKRIKSSKTKES